MCSVICSSNISWITRSTISLRKEGSSSKIPCASCVSTLRWSVVIVLLPFDRLTLGTNHLGGRWPFFLPAHQITEVYGHNLAYSPLHVSKSLCADLRTNKAQLCKTTLRG